MGCRPVLQGVYIINKQTCFHRNCFFENRFVFVIITAFQCTKKDIGTICDVNTSLAISVVVLTDRRADMESAPTKFITTQQRKIITHYKLNYFRI